MSHNQEIGRLEGQNQILQEELSSLQNYFTELEALDHLEKIFHANGIPYQIIEEKMPVINNEINKILMNVVNFRVFFEKNDKRLEIMIQHPEQKMTPLELGSGSEKSLACMAIRFALRKITTLPKSDLLILDEPGTDLDKDNREGLLKILELAKEYFQTILIISHLDFLKEAADEIIEIENVAGFAKISHN